MVTTEPIKIVASPSQTADGKDLSRPFMAVALPKSQDPLCTNPVHSATQNILDPLSATPAPSATQNFSL